MKKFLSERDICTKFITPAIKQAGWDVLSQICEEVSFTKGRIIVRGKLVTRGKGKRADYILYYKPNIPIALIEAKDNNYAVGDGMQQALEYATTLDIPFVFSTNGDAFLFHDRTGQSGQTETEIPLALFPPPGDLWTRYSEWKNLAPVQEKIFLQNYFEDGGGKEPRYYQRIAINKAIDLESGLKSTLTARRLLLESSLNEAFFPQGQPQKSIENISITWARGGDANPCNMGRS
jgi:type I restriction enzyme, R subunit